MAKAVVNAVVGGALVLAGASQGGASAGETLVIPDHLLAQFDKFMNSRENQLVATAAIPPATGKLVATAAIPPATGKLDTLLAAPGKPGKPVRLASTDTSMQFFMAGTAEAAPMVSPPSFTPTTHAGCTLPAAAGTADIPPATGRHFEIGDKLKLAVFENVKDVEKNQWGNGPSGFQQHPELSGDYTVQDDGTISVPVLGAFSVLEITPKELQTQLADAFQKVLGHKGFITIQSIDRPPIYVLGPVKNQGQYNYSPGMTVLHAVTLAGGFPTDATAEPWQKLESVRESRKRLGTLESMSELWARRAVLQAERDHIKPVAPPQLVNLVGPAKATQMIAIEVDRRTAIVSARKSRVDAGMDTVRVAQQEIEALSTKSRSLDAQERMIAALRVRAEGIERLYDAHQLNNAQLIDARSRVAEAERAKQEMINQLAQAKNRLATAQGDFAKIDADTRGDLDNQILTITDQIANASRENDTSEGILGALRVQYSPATASGGGVAYEIVRQTAKGPREFVGTGMTQLVPGDLVKIVPPGTHDPEVKSPDAVNPTNKPTLPISASTDCK